MKKLLEEIIGSVQTTDPSVTELKENKKFPHLIDKEKTKQFKSPLFPLFLCLAFLGGLLLGTTFGYSWGNSRKTAFDTATFEEMDTKIMWLTHEVQEIKEKIAHPSIMPEIIEPLQAASEFQILAPEILN